MLFCQLGLMFLLKAEEQHRLIQRLPQILVPGSRLLFTATAKPAVWTDVMTGLESISLGAAEYRKLLGAAGISVTEEYEDVGQNYYFDGVADSVNVERRELGKDKLFNTVGLDCSRSRGCITNNVEFFANPDPLQKECPCTTPA